MRRVREKSVIAVFASVVVVAAARLDASVVSARGAKESVVEGLPVGVEGVAHHLAHVQERGLGGWW